MSRHARPSLRARLATKFRGRSTVLNPAHCCGLGPDGKPPVRYERFPLPPGMPGIDTTLYIPVTREETR